MHRRSSIYKYISQGFQFSLDGHSESERKFTLFPLFPFLFSSVFGSWSVGWDHREFSLDLTCNLYLFSFINQGYLLVWCMYCCVSWILQDLGLVGEELQHKVRNPLISILLVNILVKVACLPLVDWITGKSRGLCHLKLSKGLLWCPCWIKLGLLLLL